MRTRLAPSLLLAVSLAGTGSAQTVARAPSGTLRGTVQDSATGEPVGYALVVLVGKGQQAFASEAGRFTLTNLAAGKVRLRVQQIGYRPQTLALTIDTRPGAVDASSALSVRLSRQAIVLPEVSVEGKTCLDLREAGSTAQEGGTLLSGAIQNAERISMLERQYPFVLTFQRVYTLLDSAHNRISGQVDTLVKDSRAYVPYREGKVLARVFGRERLSSFTTSDFAGEEFQKTHCFWYAGRDSVAGFAGYRIDFEPRPEVKSPDWAGSMLVDSASIGLLRTEIRLVNLPAQGTNLLTAGCTIFYQPIVRSLPQEFQTRCVSSQRGGPSRIRVERWLLVSHRFVGKTPVRPEPPG